MGKNGKDEKEARYTGGREWRKEKKKRGSG